jgi:hypothetical protein
MSQLLEEAAQCMGYRPSLSFRCDNFGSDCSRDKCLIYIIMKLNADLEEPFSNSYCICLLVMIPVMQLHNSIGIPRPSRAAV